jgi:hypothetical protein
MSNETVNGIVVDAPNKEASNKSIRFANPDVLDDNENEEIDDGEDDDNDENAASVYPKRKRASINYKYDDYVDAGNEEPAAKRSRMDSTRVRGVIIGVWRASSEPIDEDKHIVYGFVDKDNRLRTRLHARNRRGEELIGNIPTGTGRCWVTFPEIILDPHLAALSAPEIKEYVKLRSDDEPEATENAQHEADLKAVEGAKAAVLAASASTKRKSQTTPGRPPHGNSRHSTIGRTPLSPSKARNTPKLKNTDFAKAHSPAEGPNTGILLGYWKDSSEKRKEDKHAIFGIVGGSGFRVKVHKATRDGRVVIGNYPAGAGGLFVTYDKLVLEPQLASLSKQQVREYVKLRQDDVRRGESEKDRKRHEQRAIDKVTGKERVATVETEESGTEQEVEPEPKLATIRRTPRTERKAASRSQERDELPLQQKRKEKTDEREKGRENPRGKHLSDKAVIDEAVQRKLSQNIKGLQEIWQAQNAATLSHTNGAGASGGSDQDDVKFHNGLKYEKKASGLLQGKFVHHPAIVTVDGEAWVEYRFLSKELL